MANSQQLVEVRCILLATYKITIACHLEVKMINDIRFYIYFSRKYRYPGYSQLQTNNRFIISFIETLAIAIHHSQKAAAYLKDNPKDRCHKSG